MKSNYLKTDNKLVGFLENLVSKKGELHPSSKGKDFEKLINDSLRFKNFREKTDFKDICNEIHKFLNESDFPIDSTLQKYEKTVKRKFNTYLNSRDNDSLSKLLKVSDLFILTDDQSQYLLNNSQILFDFFIDNPCGSQAFPDFIIINSGYVFLFEAKYNQKAGNIAWNSNVPRYNTIYIYGNGNNSNLSCFIGKDILSIDDYQKLHNFFSPFEEEQKKFNTDPSNKNEFGFSVYIRKAFSQKKGLMIDPSSEFNFHKLDNVKTSEYEISTYNFILDSIRNNGKM